MEKIVYTEDIISEYPTSSRMFDAYQGLKDELCKMEAERDEMFNILQELSEAESPEDIEEVMTRVKDFAENRTFISGY